MNSWSKGFMAGCASVLAAVMLISILVLPSASEIMDSVQKHGSSVVASVFSTGSKTKKYLVTGGTLEFLNEDNIKGVVETADLAIGSNGFDDW